MDVELDRDRFSVFAPDLSKAVADLADCNLGLDGCSLENHDR